MATQKDNIMITLNLKPSQVCSYYATATKNFTNEQPERFYCYSKNGNECKKNDLVKDKNFKEENSSLFFFDNKLMADLFYNLICEHTENQAYYCSDEHSFEEPYVVCVNINIIESGKSLYNLLNFKSNK